MYYFKRVTDGEVTGVESKSVDVVSPGFVKATRREYDDFIFALSVVEPELLEPGRDLTAEIDEIKAKIAKLDGLKARIEKLEKK